MGATLGRGTYQRPQLNQSLRKGVIERNVVQRGPDEVDIPAPRRFIQNVDGQALN